MFLSSLYFLLLLLRLSLAGAPKVASAWYAGWHATAFPPSSISWSKYTQLTYAFAITTSDASVISIDESDKLIIPQFVAAAHENNVKASISIGGWTGSRFFSTHVGSSNNRSAFVDVVLDLVAEYSFDGVDFDWEYPNRQGLGCNTVSVNDTANFLSFLQELRDRPAGKDLILSAATGLKPFNDSSSKPMEDVTAFAQVLDYIAIMNYDVWSPLSVAVGPNAPLNDTCAPSQYRSGSAVSSVDAWAKAGMPKDQIVLGVGSYGHSFSIDADSALDNGKIAAYPSSNPRTLGKGDRWDGDGGIDVCGVEQGPSGVYTYWGLIEEGFVHPNGTALDGIGYRYDTCSQTPYVYDEAKQVIVSFDNPESFSAKGKFITDNGLAGFAMWEAAGDSQDILLDSILSAASDETRSPPASQPASTTGSANAPAASDTSSASPSLYRFQRGTPWCIVVLQIFLMLM